MGNSDDIELGTRLTELAGPEAGPGREVTVPLTPLPFSFFALFPDHACLLGPLQVEAGSESENCRQGCLWCWGEGAEGAELGLEAGRRLPYPLGPSGKQH